MLGSTKVRNFMRSQVEREIKQELKNMKLDHIRRIVYDEDYMKMAVEKTAKKLMQTKVLDR